MDAGAPDPDPSPPSRQVSLATRLRASLRGREPGAAWVPYAVATLLAASPVLTIAGARLLTAREQAGAARLETSLGPRIAARVAAAEARAALAPVLAGLPAAAVLDALARVLPRDASLVRAERLGNGAIELDIAAPDPDSVRAALRRSPNFARVRPLGQRQGDGTIVATFMLEGA